MLQWYEIAGDKPDHLPLQGVSRTISDKLAGKRSLAVLDHGWADGVWTEDRADWERFMVNLKSGAPGTGTGRYMFFRLRKIRLRPLTVERLQPNKGTVRRLLWRMTDAMTDIIYARLASEECQGSRPRKRVGDRRWSRKIFRGEGMDFFFSRYWCVWILVSAVRLADTFFSSTPAWGRQSCRLWNHATSLYYCVFVYIQVWAFCRYWFLLAPYKLMGVCVFDGFWTVDMALNVWMN